MGNIQEKNVYVGGCGKSVNSIFRDINSDKNSKVIGVSDVERLLNVDYLIISNHKYQYSRDRYHYIENSNASHIFTPFPSITSINPIIVYCKPGKYGGTNFADRNEIDYHDSSVYMAICIAIHMGFKKIGLVGIDFNKDHFFAETGDHPLRSKLEQIDEQFRKLRSASTSLGIEFYNLSKTSSINAFRKCDISRFQAM